MNFKKTITILSTFVMFLYSLCSCNKDSNNTISCIDAEYMQKITTVINEYIESLESCDYTTYSSYQTAFYNEAYENYAVTNGFENGEQFFIENEYGYYKSTLGNNFNITVTIDKISIIPENELITGENTIKSTFKIDNIDITKGFEVTVTEDAIGNKGNETESYEIMLLEIDNELYVYNQYFEYLSSVGF